MIVTAWGQGAGAGANSNKKIEKRSSTFFFEALMAVPHLFYKPSLNVLSLFPLGPLPDPEGGRAPGRRAIWPYTAASLSKETKHKTPYQKKK